MTLNLLKPVDSSLGASADIRANQLALARTLGGINLIRDSVPIIWAAGDAALPTCWNNSSGAPTPAREVGAGKFVFASPDAMSLKLTAGGGQGIVWQNTVPPASMASAFFGSFWGFGAWVWASVAGKVRLAIDDGAGSVIVSASHPGTSDWQWLTCAGQIHATAPVQVRPQLIVDASQVGYFSAMTMLFGEAPPQHWQPEPAVLGTIYHPVNGNVAVNASVARFIGARPFIVRDVNLDVLTAPATQALICDVEHWDGSVWQTMFTARPQIAAAAVGGSARPDGTYRYRCFTGGFGASFVDARLRTAVDQIGTGTVGADLSILVRCLQFCSPLESIYPYDLVA